MCYLFLPLCLQILVTQMTVPFLRHFSLSYAGTVHVSLTLASFFHILCYDDRSQFPTYDKDSGNHYPLHGNTGVQEYKSRSNRMKRPLQV